jgi:hypothetical protein
VYGEAATRENRYHLFVVVRICSFNATCFRQNFCSARKIFDRVSRQGTLQSMRVVRRAAARTIQ